MTPDELQLSGLTIPNPAPVRQARSVTRLASGGALHVGGARGGVPVLFLHGVGGGAWSWEPQAEALSDICRCFVWEARGHGLAARVDDAGLGDYFVDATEALAAAADAGGASIVVGHSMGGLLAMALAAESPERVRALALLEPVYAPDGGRHLGGVLAGAGRVALAPLVGSMQRDGAASRVLSRAVFDAAFEDRAARERAWRKQRTQVPVEYPKMMYEAFEGPTGFPNRAFRAKSPRRSSLSKERSHGNARAFPRRTGIFERVWASASPITRSEEDTIFNWTGPLR